MNNISILLAAVVLPLILSGCMAGNVKAPPPSSHDAAGIVIKIPNTCLPLTPCANKTLTFARLQADGEVISDELYHTSLVKGDHYYLLNVTPGRYVAVAATYTRRMNNSTNLGGGAVLTTGGVFGENILFSDELVRQTQVEVKPGTLAVMGEYDFSIEGRMVFAPSAAQFMKRADQVQLHYARKLDPEMESRGVTSGVKFYRAELESGSRDEETRRKLLGSAEKHIGKEGWDKTIVYAEN